jgi:lysophospholipase L1-like esterase
MRNAFVLLLASFALAAALGANACGDGTSDAPNDLFGNAQGGVYLALGDSIAAGSGASDANSTSYVAIVAQELRGKLGDTLELRNLAVGGNTTQDLIDEQLLAALDALRAVDVRLVTITISGNDLNIIQNSPDAAACIADVNDPKCPVSDILIGTEQRLDTILSALRAAAPDTTIVFQVYPDLFSGTGHPFEKAAGVAFGKLNDVIQRVAGKHGVLIADPRAAFDGKGGELTHTLDPTPDFHPNDAGHQAIAGAFLKVLGLSTTD